VTAKVYPPGQITRYGATLLQQRVHPMIIYTSHDKGIEWNLHGPMAPMPGVQEGAYLADGISGLHPSFTQVEYKGARQDGVTHQHTVFDPAEMDMQVEFTAAPNHTNPEESAAAIRRVIREWMESWDPKNPGTLSWTTPDMGRWWCQPRLFRSPPEKQFKAQARRLRQRYTWTIRNDEAFWRSAASVCVFDAGHTNQVTTTFPAAIPGNLGTSWEQIYSGPGGGVQEVVDSQAVWTPSGDEEREVVNVLQGVNEVRVVSVAGIATGGNFFLTFEDEQTANLAHNASAAQVKTALEALPSIGAGNVSVTGVNGGPWTVEFIGALGLQEISETLTATSSLTGSNPPVVVGQGATGASGAVAAGTTAVTISTGELHQPPNIGPGGAPGAPGVPPPPPANTASINIFGWFNSSRTNGVQANISNGNVILSSIFGGITTIFKVAVGVIGTIANAVFTLVTEVVEVAVGIFKQVVSLIANGIRVVFGILGAIIGTFFEVIGFGSHAGADDGGQQAPPPITGVGAGNPVTTASGQIVLTNIGDQDGYPDYLCYGPGIFRIANGPGSTQMIEFGPLVAGQIGLLRTLPSKRGVVDMTPNQPSLTATPQFTDFIARLVSLATNGNITSLRLWFQSLFGMTPPQGMMYALLKGRFTNPIPPKPTGVAPTPVKIKAEILDGNVNSKIIAALTPLRRWPE